MVKTGAAILITALLTLTACAGEEDPAPVETLDPEITARLIDATFACIDEADMAACNRLRDMARGYAPDSNYERIGATCGERLTEPLPRDEYCPVP